MHQHPSLCPQSVWLCDPMDGSPPGSSVHGILQARILEWGAISSSGGSSWPRGRTHTSASPALVGRPFTTEPRRKPPLMCQRFIKPTSMFGIFPPDQWPFSYILNLDKWPHQPCTSQARNLRTVTNPVIHHSPSITTLPPNTGTHGLPGTRGWVPSLHPWCPTLTPAT